MTGYRYPGEEGALHELLHNAAVKLMLDTFQSVYADATAFAELRNRNFLVTSVTNPRIFRLYQIAKRRLEFSRDIPLYTSMEYKREAETVGADGDCAIVLHSACVEAYTDEELLAVLGRELCHIQYEHVNYLNLGGLTDRILGQIPVVGAAAAQTAKALLLTWRRLAEYTADRGAAIAANGIEPAMDTLLYGMGALHPGDDPTPWTEKNCRRLLPDGDELPEGEMTKVGQMVFQMLIEEIPVPFGMSRLRELKRWGKSAECSRKFPQVYYSSLSEYGLEDFTDGQAMYQQAKHIIPSNYERGMALLHGAVKRKQPDALVFLARCYLVGDGRLTKNTALGLEWMREAALQGHPDGLYGLAVCFQSGNGLPANLEAAERLIRAAASRGQAQAAAWLESHPSKQAFLHPEAVKKLFIWFLQSYSDGSCTVNEGEPGEKLELSAELRQVKDRLWIPLDEPVYAVEDPRMADVSIALCRTGLYYWGGTGLPRYIPWPELAKGKLDGAAEGGKTRLYWNGDKLCRYDPESRTRSLAVLVIRMKAQLEQGGKRT